METTIGINTDKIRAMIKELENLNKKPRRKKMYDIYGNLIQISEIYPESTGSIVTKYSMKSDGVLDYLDEPMEGL